jgi:hypothetical protein
MKDRDFLIWLHARLQHVHGESHIVDYMHKLRAVISSTPADQDTPNDGRGKNNIKDLLKSLRHTQEPAIFMGEKKTLKALRKGGAK